MTKPRRVEIDLDLILQVADGVTSKVLRLLHQLVIEATKSGAERLTDEAVDQWQPMTPNERLFT